jgi:tight adherence protein C
MDQLKLMSRQAQYMVKLQQKLNRVNYQHQAKNADQLKRFVAKTVALIVGVHFLFTIIGLISTDGILMYGIGLFVSGCIPFVRMKALDKTISERDRRIVADLPELLDKMCLLMNAGETLQRALIRSTDKQVDAVMHPLYAEVSRAVLELDQNGTFSRVMENLNRRCGVQEVSVFVNTILMNHRKGGEQFVYTLRELSRQLWEKKKAAAKTLGEEASSKMIFPMLLIFIVIMMVVAAPAVLMMK